MEVEEEYLINSEVVCGVVWCGVVIPYSYHYHLWHGFCTTLTSKTSRKYHNSLWLDGTISWDYYCKSERRKNILGTKVFNVNEEMTKWEY
jgi:hypothetical protein